ncbi:hypothetical protein CAPTEDRAFT_184140 [Capitella teleta]|uniref:BHLH domain-containing protein n=1 Tax=Capitella teleta TaxID=283909 RepID=R7UQH9_CAPTE|nr:hypothetical protein CAPTEDRAFT_184140 [Capitella teleta]|eukprot:ELU05661.1 hypothetical protein CAPTEDRAFT_184140 [Capitella teleta]
MDLDAWGLGHSSSEDSWNINYNEENFWPCQQTYSEFKAEPRKIGVKKVRQRSAANQRERKRMRTINDAFDGLRCRIPDAKEDKKVSKVDTLRMAISYINQLTDVLKAQDPSTPHDAETQMQKKRKETVLIRYHSNDDVTMPCSTSYPPPVSSEFPLYGHTLSWKEAEVPGCPGPDQRLSAKIWTPQQASLDDMANL